MMSRVGGDVERNNNKVGKGKYRRMVEEVLAVTRSMNFQQ